MNVLLHFVFLYMHQHYCGILLIWFNICVIDWAWLIVALVFYIFASLFLHILWQSSIIMHFLFLKACNSRISINASRLKLAMIIAYIFWIMNNLIGHWWFTLCRYMFKWNDTLALTYKRVLHWKKFKFCLKINAFLRY